MRPAAFVAPLVVSLALVVTGCGSGAGTTTTASDEGTRSAARAPLARLTCPDAGSRIKYYLYVENTSASPVRLRVSGVDCAKWSGAANPSAMDDMVIAARSTAPYVTLTPRFPRDENATWRVQPINGEMPDSPFEMQLEKKSFGQGGAWSVHINVRPGPDEPWSTRLTTQKGMMRYAVASNTCTFSDSCFTLKLAFVESPSAQRAP